MPGYVVGVNDLLQLKGFAHRQGQAGINVCHFLVTAVGGASLDQGQVAADMSAYIGGAQKALMDGTAAWDGLSVQRINVATPPLPAFDNSGTGTGTGTGQPIPSQVCGVVGKQTALAGRRYRGRLYAPFIAAQYMSALETPTAAFVINLGVWGARWLSTRVVAVGGDTATLAPMLYHRDTRTWTPIINSLPKLKWGTQRRRGDYGRPNP